MGNVFYGSEDLDTVQPGTDYTRMHLSRSFHKSGSLCSITRHSDLRLDLSGCHSLEYCLWWVRTRFKGWTMVFATHHVYSDVEKGWVRQPGHVS